MTSAYIISACRSPVTPRGGALAHLSLPDLAAPILTAALTRAGIAPRQVDEVICSTALGPGGNAARKATRANRCATAPLPIAARPKPIRKRPSPRGPNVIPT